MELDHEKFEGARELAEISVKISEGLSTLASLKESEEEYFQERERGLNARLKQALVESSELIEAIGTNHSALVGYSTELTEAHEKVLSLLKGIMECRALLDETSSEIEKKIATHEKNIIEFRNASQRERVLIEGDRNELRAQRKTLDDDQRLLNDRKAMFERTLERAKK